MVDHEFLILHGVIHGVILHGEIQNFVDTCVFGIKTLTAFNQNAKGAHGVPFWYKGVNSVLLASERR